MVVGEPCDRKLASFTSMIELGLQVHLNWSLKRPGSVTLVDMRLSFLKGMSPRTVFLVFTMHRLGESSQIYMLLQSFLKALCLILRT
jgi:hypothetical protein